MKIALTGATGLLGRFLLQLLPKEDITILGRTPLDEYDFLPFELGAPPPPLAGHDALIHSAFSHIPGRYRGGEGDDPEGFKAKNLDGSLQLLDAAMAAGVKRIIFISSRSVFDGYPSGTSLLESLPARPINLYGEIKHRVEEWLSMIEGATSLRLTGIYGKPTPHIAHKWESLFADFAQKKPIEPRSGSEIYGMDAARAVQLLLHTPSLAPAYHASDILLDRRNLLERWSRISGILGGLPEASDASEISLLDCTRLKALGWAPGGFRQLDAWLREMQP